jgi:hypothetical protein
MVCLNAHVSGMAVEQSTKGLPGWPGPSRNLLRSTVSGSRGFPTNTVTRFGRQETSDDGDDGDCVHEAQELIADTGSGREPTSDVILQDRLSFVTTQGGWTKLPLQRLSIWAVERQSSQIPSISG